MAINTFTGATNNNWGTATNWSQGTVPTAVDGHTTTFDNTSPNCTVDTSARVCQILTFNGGTGYTNTITMTNTITVSGNITLGASMVIAGIAALILGANSTFTSNGKTWSNGLSYGSFTLTLGDNVTVSGTLQGFNGSALGVITGAFTLHCQGDVNIAGQTTSGTALVLIDGTGTQNIAIETSRGYNGDLTINKPSGTLTVSSNLTGRGGHTWTIAANQTITWGTFVIADNSGILILDCNGNTIYGLNVAGLTVQLASSLIISGSFSVGTGGLISSTVSSTSRKLTVLSSATVTLLTVLSITDIDSSSGQRIYIISGTLTRTANWAVLNIPKYYTFHRSRRNKISHFNQQIGL